MKSQKHFRHITSILFQFQNILACILCGCLFNTAYAAPQGAGFNVNTQFMHSKIEQYPELNFDMTELRLSAPFMSLDTNLGKLVFGADYINTELKFSNTLADKTLHNLELPITLVQDLDQWEFIYQVAPTINSDLEEVSEDDFSINGKLIANYETELGNLWAFGVAANESFGKAEIYPIMGYHIKSVEHWDLRVTIPNPEFSYLPLTNVRFSLYGVPRGREWNINLENELGLQEEWNTNYSGYQFGFKALLRSPDKYWASFTVGRELNRSVDQDEMGYEVDIEDENFITLSFGYEI